jgi:hypothetical protein
MGAGYGRTWTASLKLVLDDWASGLSYHMSEVQSVTVDDMVFIAPGFGRLVGHDAMRSWLERYLAAYDARWEKSNVEVVIEGDWAFEQHSYRSTNEPNARGALSDRIVPGSGR